MVSQKKSKSRAAPYHGEKNLAQISNALQTHLDPVSLIALREASKTMRNTYAPPEFPRRKRLYLRKRNGTRRPLYQPENLKPGANQIRHNRSLRTVWKSIKDSARLKKYPAGGASTVPGGGLRQIMKQMPNDIKIKYMKRLEDLYKAKCVAQLYQRRAFTPRNKPFVPTNSNRIERYNTMAREQNPTLQGFQSYRQRTLLPVVAEGMARLPQKPNPTSRRQPIVVN
jgi:hypothetical protein